MRNERLQKCIDNYCRKTKFHEDMMFCKVKNSGNQDSSSEDPSVANTNFGYVNETNFCQCTCCNHEQLVNSKISPLPKSAQLDLNTNYEFSAEMWEILIVMLNYIKLLMKT